MTLDDLPDVWVTGVRRAGGEERVEAGDLWHLGSCTKSMTATLIALLAARGDLAWDTALGDLLPDLAEHMHPDFLDVTLLELLGHRAGVTNTQSRAFKDGFAEIEKLPLVEQRARVALDALAQAPVHTRGKFLYSNLGYVIAGHAAEVATGRPWEALARELLFQPLRMTSAGFGAPGTAEPCDQPRGHTDGGEPVEPGPDADNPAFLGPGGTVHASLADWAKYAQLHMRGHRGEVKVGEVTLTREAFGILHRPCAGPKPEYALGWGIEKHDWAGGDGTILAHNGSNTLWYCVSWLGLESGAAVLVTANQASPAAKGVVNEVGKILVDELARRAKEVGR